MAGRVIPVFTMAALPGVHIKTLPWLERSVLAHTTIGLALWLFALAAFAPISALAEPMRCQIFTLPAFGASA